MRRWARWPVQRGWGTLRGKFVLTAGLGGMGGAQPLAITMNGGVGLVVEVDPARARRRQEIGYVDVVVDTLEEAMTLVEEAREQQIPRSIGLIGNAAEIYPELVMRGVDPGRGHRPDPGPRCAACTSRPGSAWKRPRGCARPIRKEYERRSMASMAAHVQAMLEFQKRGAEVFDYGNNLRQRAFDFGVSNAFDFPGFVPAYIRPLFCEGKGPFRWVALSGDPEDIYRTDGAVMELFPEDEHLHRWLEMARQKVPFQGLPARICWLGYGERARAGLKFNEMVASGELSAPIVIGRDHLDAGSVASPNRETEAMRDGIGRDQRLADPECADQRGQRGHLGLLPSRRRGGDRFQPARRAGDRGGWQPGSGPPPGARADLRPGHGGGAPRGCRVSGGDPISRKMPGCISPC